MKTRAEAMAASRKYRLELRKAVIDAIEKKRKELGYSNVYICALSGINTATWFAVRDGNGDRITFDALLLMASKVGLKVEMTIQLEAEAV